ncbi:Uncharacterised protein [Klebsiella pneumoniae]|nr:Uncharacterised protein [Klebsiella pneumoniae]
MLKQYLSRHRNAITLFIMRAKIVNNLVARNATSPTIFTIEIK